MREGATVAMRRIAFTQQTTDEQAQCTKEMDMIVLQFQQLLKKGAVRVG